MPPPNRCGRRATKHEFYTLGRCYMRIFRLILRRSATLGVNNMPFKRWRHTCGCYGDNFLGSGPDCNCCGYPGEYDGRHLSMVEAMSAHAKVYGLKPLGPHRDYQRKLMGPLYRSCEVCEGRGIVEIPWLIWSECPLCNGTTLVPQASRDQIAKARQQVLSVYPGAGVPW